MKPTLHQLSLPGAMLARGFWLYVWEVTDVFGKKWLYVGRTGDSSLPNAQSPFTRLTQHLSQNPKSNALRRNLAKAGVEPDMPFVPPNLLWSNTDGVRNHGTSSPGAGQDGRTRKALNRAGYRVLNDVKSRHPINEPLMANVHDAFASRFTKLGNPS